MPLVIGVDEAGYGPRIGPLVVALSAWQVPSTCEVLDPPALDKLLEPVVCRVGRSAAGAPAIYVDDSKKIYHSPRDFPRLETSAVTLLSLAGWTGSDLGELLTFFDQSLDPRWRSLPWLRDECVVVPHSITRQNLAETVGAVSRHLKTSGVDLLACQGAIIFELVFNERIRQLGNKATLVAEVVVELLARLFRHLGADACVFVDRQGGRVYYAPVLKRLAAQLPRAAFEIVHESAERSSYRIVTSSHVWRVTFCRRGEQFLPVAAASIVAKYLRELVLWCFNTFWKCQLPGLRPTAGYPADAKRFKAEIASCQKALGIPDDWLWRMK